MKRALALLLPLLLLLFCSCGHRRQALDPIRQARVDALNKESFVNRYKNPKYAITMADSALRYIADSLPDYAEGYARAMNNRRFCLYMISEYTEVAECDGFSEVEQVLAQLLEARWAQRHCETARSYSILTDIERSGVLRKNRDNYLYAYAQSEYYITQLLLNYHYRYGSLINGEELLDEIDQTRHSLRVDYAQDMALNYAMAYSYLCLAEEADTARQAPLIQRSLGLLIENLRILSRPGSYSPYDMALSLEMMNFITYNDALSHMDWEATWPQWDCIYDMLRHTFGLEPGVGQEVPDLVAASVDLFLQLDDPYQRIGGCVDAAEFILARDHDTALAHEYYAQALSEAQAIYGFAPKIELMLYEGLIRSVFPGSIDDYGLWFDRLTELRTYIAENQSADFQMQLELEESRQANHRIWLVVIVVSALTVALIIALLLLRRRTRALAREKHLLEEAKRTDVERIANVETCLSVLRHDITPFFSYLQNKNLPEGLRAEVLDQLVRTFDNIKSWTTLSAPTGVRFVAAKLPIGEVFAEVESHVVNLHPDAVALRFQPTDLHFWGDRQLMVILLRNLVTNALQHTERGSITVSASVYEEDNQFLHITVADTGAGLTPEALEELFRSDKRPSASGHGFGLILCRYIIKQHDDHTLRGCRIWAESAPGQGTQFHLLLASAR